jgi:hypothetical protein
MKKSFVDRVKDAFTKKDEQALTKAIDELPAEVKAKLTADCGGRDESVEAGGHHIHIHAGSGEGADDMRSRYTDDELDKRFGGIDKTIGDNHKAVMDSLEELKGKKKEEEGAADAETREVEGALKEEAPSGTGDAAVKATDSAYLADSFQETVALAEIIAPGISVPSFDQKSAPRKTLNDIVWLRRKALQFATNDAAGAAMIEQTRGGKALTADDLTKLSAREVRPLFFAVGALRKVANGRSNTNDSRGTEQKPKVTTLADINKRNREAFPLAK